MSVFEVVVLTAWLTSMFWVNAYFIGYFLAKGLTRGKYENFR